MRYGFMALLVCFLTGCTAYTPEQQAKINSASDSITRMGAELNTLYKESRDIQSAIAAVVKRVANGDLPIAEGKVLMDALKVDQESIRGNIKNVQEEVATIKTTYDELKAQGISGWQIIGTMLMNLALGAVGLRGAQKVRTKSGVMGI